jgi:hypothetical protein
MPKANKFLTLNVQTCALHPLKSFTLQSQPKMLSDNGSGVAQMVEVLNGLTARDGLCLLVGCILTVLDEAPSDVERQQSPDNCIDLLKGVPVRSND